jgi:hypothetical protein
MSWTRIMQMSKQDIEKAIQHYKEVKSNEKRIINNKH